MTTRHLTLPAMVLALLVAGCTYPDAPKGDDPEQAPPPREKAAKPNDPRAALLVGKWKLVKCSAPLLEEGYKSTREFTADGKVTIWTDNPAAQRRMWPNPETISGTYRLEGGKLILTLGPPGKTQEITLIIESLTRDKLTTSTQPPPGGSPDQRVIGEYERIQQKL
jgi:uncharacterized protein (TIGR03066 family)